MSTHRIGFSRKLVQVCREGGFVKNNIDFYFDEIRMIIQAVVDGQSRPHEVIGEFNVSPRGYHRRGIRVAWRLNGGLFFDDFLYHVTDSKYNGDWSEKVCTGVIVPAHYEKDGYLELDEFATAIA